MQAESVGFPSKATPPLARRFFASWLAVGLGGMVSTLITVEIGGGADHRLIVWPMTGVILALALPIAPERRKFRFLLYSAGAIGTFIGGMLAGMPIWVAVTIFALTCLDTFVADLILCPHIRSFEDLKKRRNVLRLVLASVAAPLVTGLLGGLLLAGYLKTPAPIMMAMCILADAIGIGTFIPTLLFITNGKHFLARTLPAKSLPLLLSCTFFTVVCVGTFWQNIGPYLFLMFPAMMVLLLTAGLEGGLFTSIMVLIVGSYATIHGHGPISLVRTIHPEVRLLTLQVFIWVSIVTALPVGAALDERRKAELTLVNSRSVQQAILRHTREAVILSSLDGRERYASAAIEQITGWTPAEYMLLTREQTVHPEDWASACALIESVATGTRETSIRYRIMHKDGSWSWVEASVSAYGEDETGGYVGTVRDIDRLIETEQGWIQDRRVFSEEQQRLTEAEHAANFQIKLRDEFLSHVSHELRSPLTSIYSFSSIIADGLAGTTTPEQDEYLGIVLKNVVQLQTMIEDLLTVTQSSEGKLNIEMQSVCLTDAVKDALNTVRSFANRKEISLSIERLDDSSLVYADPIRVRQILIILLDNAIKFTPQGGAVKINISLQNAGFMLIKVIDTGCGIPEDKWKLVFNKLYQVGGSNKADTSTAGRTGLGLGLHIARSLVVRQSGHIWVSGKPNQGSIFQFTLPLLRDQVALSNSDALGQRTEVLASTEI